MIRVFRFKYFRAIKVGAIVGAFPLIFLLGVAMSMVKIDPSSHTSVNSSGEENKPLADSQENPLSNPVLATSTTNNIRSAQTTPHLANVVAPKEPIREQTIFPAAITPPVPEIETMPVPLPQDPVQCPQGTYIDASDNKVCRPLEDYPVQPVPPVEPLPCNIVLLDDFQVLPPIVCLDQSV